MLETLTTEQSEAKAALDLGWADLLDTIARHAMGALGADRIRATEPADSVESARERMLRVAEAVAARKEGSPIPAQPVPDVSELLGRLAKGAVAGAEELLGLRRMLEAARALRHFAKAQVGRPVLAAAIASDDRLDELLAVLRDSITDDGDVADSASPELRRARQKLDESRRTLLKKLEQLMSRYETVLRDKFYTERDGRYVLPVRTDAPFRLDGIVLGSSGSGGTLYVEPREVGDLGNTAKMAEAAVERERARVLTRLSEGAGRYVSQLQQAFVTCIVADTLSAISIWAAAVDAVALTIDAEPVADLIAMRHPLLLDGETPVIANDLRLAAERGLIISGPNAGGKTVALKCFGLAALMARAGLPIPADARSKIGFFDSVLTDVGDEQSLAKSLSTFSAHVARLAQYIERSRRGTLVLLDEVAAGTDPDEGSALALAVLEAMVEKGAAVAVTTHYERLKEFGAHDPRFENASVGFDMRAMRPTFRLTLGQPGASSALAVAERFGISPRIVERARELIPEIAKQREDLVHRLEAERVQLESARRSAEEDRAAQNRIRADLEAQRATIREKERERLARERQELTAAVRDAREQLRQVSRRARTEQTDREAIRQMEKAVSGAAQLVAIDGAFDAATRATSPHERRPIAEERLAPGTAVFVERLGAAATVLEAPQRGEVRVAAGTLKLTVPVSEVSLDVKTKQRAARQARPKTPSKSRGAPTAAPMRVDSNTCDVRGLRVDEALEKVDVFIDHLLSEGESAGFVLHGHGTGALKSAIRDHLASARFVAYARPAEPEDGGDAFTVFGIAD